MIWQYWDSESIPPYVDELLATFEDLNGDLGHQVFSERDAAALIAESFTARELAAFEACAVPSMQSDYFRYCVVLSRGGIYADADCRCLTSLRPLLERDQQGELFFRPDAYPVGGHSLHRFASSFFAFREPGHPLLRLSLDIATANMEARICERVWAKGENVIASIWLTVGPGIFTMLHYLDVLGSFDRLIAAAAGTEAEPFMDLYCQVIGSRDRVAEAFDGVRLSSFHEMSSWIGPDAPLAYKETDVHWQNVTTSIFR